MGQLGLVFDQVIANIKKWLMTATEFLHPHIKKVHYHAAGKHHERFMNQWQWYSAWHNWSYHKHVHFGTLGIYLLIIGAVLLSNMKGVFAGDLNDNWDFSTPANFSFDSGVEASGATARLKAQNYSSDANTMTLFHLDESSGTTANDASSNNNNGTVTSENWQTGNLNNGLSLNGTTSKVSVPDSASLSLSQNNTIEGWTKFNSSFSAGSHTQRQTIADKGDYQLYFDNETGKVTYELANSSATGWTKAAGDDVNNSWSYDGMLGVASSVVVGSDVYAGLGVATKDAEVWKFTSGSWSKVGGDGVNSSWSGEHEYVQSLETDGTSVYAGLGNGTGDAEVWKFTSGSWSKIGGDATTPGQWGIGTHEGVYSLDYFGGNLYAGLGASANDAEVWRWNGSSWTKIGGDSINSGWTTNYEYVYSMANDGTNLYVGLGITAGEAEVWRWNGTAWTKVADSGSGFGTNLEIVRSLYYDGTYLYAGLGDTAGDADLYRCSSCGSSPSWTQIGGDGLNSSWTTNYEYVHSIGSDGTNIIIGLGSSDGDGEIYSWNGSAWTKIGGDGVNSSWASADGDIVFSLSNNGSTVYAATYNSAGTGQMWSWNGSSWTRIGGNGVNKSWGFYNLQSVEVMQWVGDYLYAGTGYTVAGNAMVWRFDGSSWEIVGGQGVNSSWAAFSYEAVTSMASMGGNLYVGLGYNANDAEVWRWNGSTWTQIGGDSLNSGWTTNYEEVNAMAVNNGTLYAGIGTSANDAEVWSWNGSAWTKIGGDSLNSGWTTNYERVSSMAIYNGELYAGIGVSATEAEVWRWNGSTWSKIGGDGVSSSWTTNYETVRSMTNYGDNLIVGLGDSTGDAEVWQYNGTSWTLIGGGASSVNSSWSAGTYEYVSSMAVYNGKLYAGLAYTPAGDGELWEFNGSDDWTQIGGDTLNNGWDSNVESVKSMSPYKGKLYVGNGDSGNTEDPSIWSWGNNGFAQSSTASFDTNWHHIAATYNGSTMKIYVDGTEVGSQSASLSMPDSSRALYLGASWGGREQGKARGYFQGLLDEVRISDNVRSSFQTTPYVSTAQGVTLGAAVRTQGVASWDTFGDSETANGGTITYRLSDDDGTTWKYWNGSSWATSSSYSDSNSVSTINTNIPTFPVTFYGVKWQAVLQGNGNQQVTLNSVDLSSNSDSTAPATNASSITAQKSNGGASLSQNAWTNGSSPYFSWTAGSDAGSGIKGYCLYLGQTDTADPVTTKGILGTSPVYTGGYCQFLVSPTNIDTVVSGYIQTAMTSSNTPYYLNIKAMDNAGNVYSGSSAQFYFRFDNTAPGNPGYITAPSGFINTKSATLTWATSGGDAPSDTNSGVQGLQYRIGAATPWYGDTHNGNQDQTDLLTNDGSYQTQDPPDYSNLAEGINTVYFRTWDNAGNVTTSYVTAALKINTSGAPSEPTNLIATPSTNTTNSFAFDWDIPDTFVGSASNLTYCYTINTLPSSSNCTFTPAGVTALGAGAYANQPGSNTFYVVAKDESSNINYSLYASTTFTANTTAPGIPLNPDIADVSIKSTSKWRLAITWDTPSNVGAGVANYKVYRSTNNVSFSEVGTSSSTTYIDANLSQITYYYKVAACDSTNNCGAQSTAVSMLPTGKFTEPANLVAEPEAGNISTKKATITWSTDRASDSKIAFGTQSGKYSASEVSISDQITAHEVTLDNLAAGTTYYYVAKWTDEDGNTGVSSEYSFTTDPPPSIKDVTVKNITLTGAIVEFTSKNAVKVKLYYGESEGFGGLTTTNTSVAESTYTSELAGLSDGVKYFYRLNPVDSEGTEYEGTVLSFETPPRPRIENLRFEPVEGEPTSTQQVTWTTNVLSTSLVRYQTPAQGSKEIVDSTMVTDHKVLIRGLLDDSEYSLIAESRDKDGNVAISDTQTFRTALDTRPPKVDEILIEPSIRGAGSESKGQIIVSWKTDEPSTSQVEYGEGSSGDTYNNKTAEDTALVTEHTVIVSDLATSQVYHLRPVSNDGARNAGYGKDQSAIIGRASESIITIILNTLKKVFGF